MNSPDSSDTKEIFDEVKSEYWLFVSLTRANSIQELDITLEKIFDVMFGSTRVDVLSPTQEQPHPESESSQHIEIKIDNRLIRDVVIKEARLSPTRRLLDTILEIYINQYNLLVKSQIDKLTGLHNRQVLQDRAESLNQSQDKAEMRKNTPARVLALIDIDHFKLVNDNFGHLFGDEVLILVANLLKRSFRSDDWLFRYGGEEFLVVLNYVCLEEAAKVIDRFREQVQKYPFPQIGKITVSCGFTTYDSKHDFINTIEHADQALYYAKKNGRNQIHSHEDLIAKGILTPPEVSSDIELF